MATIIPFRPRPDAKIVGYKIERDQQDDPRKPLNRIVAPGPHPDLRKPYNRSAALAFMYWLPEEWRFDPLEMQYAYPPKKALRLVLKVRRAVRKALRAQRNLQGREHFLYDRSFHLNLAVIEKRETDLAWRLLDCWQAEREAKKPKPRTAADEFNAVRADLAALMGGEAV